MGWLLNGMRGGLIAGTLFVVPGLVALLALSAVLVFGLRWSVLRVLAVSAALGLAAGLLGLPVS